MWTKLDLERVPYSSQFVIAVKSSVVDGFYSHSVSFVIAIATSVRYHGIRYDIQPELLFKNSHLQVLRWVECTVLKDIWMAPWKNQISSTTMKLRKSLVKPVTWQNISSCLVLPPEIVMHDAFNVILWMSIDICVVVHDSIGWKNRTTHCNRFWRAGCSQLEYIDIRLIYLLIINI